MNELVSMDVKKFDVIKDEVNLLVKNIKEVVVSLPKGNTGYNLMRENKRKLVTKRTELKTLFKDERAGALAYQKNIIAIEKEIIGVMTPIEDDLSAKINEIDEQKLKEKRKEELPKRNEKLKLIEVDVSDSELLEMDDSEFLQFFNEQREIYLDKKEQEAKEKAERIESERLAKIQKEEEASLEKRRKEDAERQAKIDAENKKIEADREAIRLKEQKIKDEQDAKEAEEKRVKEIEEAKKKAAKEEAERIERDRIAEKEKKAREQKEMEEKANYQDFLREYKYDESNHIIKREGKNVKLYKLVAETNL